MYLARRSEPCAAGAVALNVLAEQARTVILAAETGGGAADACLVHDLLGRWRGTASESAAGDSQCPPTPRAFA